MTFNKTLLTAAMLTFGGFAAMSNVNAATAPGSFKVNLTVTSVCSVSASPVAQDINFGTHAAGTTSSEVGEKSSAAAITVLCSKDAPYIVNLTPSNDNSEGAGVMAGPGTETIGYQLTKTAAGEAWGSGTLELEGNGVAGKGAGLAQAANSHTVFSTLTTSTEVMPGIYSDTVTVSLVY